jgi:hypothetical protein
VSLLVLTSPPQPSRLKAQGSSLKPILAKVLPEPGLHDSGTLTFVFVLPFSSEAGGPGGNVRPGSDKRIFLNWEVGE